MGSQGQLGQALCDRFAHEHDVTGWSRPQYDVSQPSMADAVADAAPDVVINAAAWTNVDGAEAAPAAAFAANALGPKYLAEGCRRCGATLVQISTNEIFAGDEGVFYREYDQPQPWSVYARSKRAGEIAALQTWNQVFVVRVAWLFGPGGNNFPVKIAATADTHDALRVVADEWGNPTYTVDVAEALAKLAASERFGTYHLVNEGHASRFELAQEVMALTGRDRVEIAPIGLDEWPRPAPPPPHAVLINQAAAALDITLRPWRAALAEYIEAEAHRFERGNNLSSER